MPELQIRLFGSFQIHYKGVAVTAVKTQRLQDLLIYLILHHNIPQARSHLAYLLWPESNNAQARTNLRNAIFILRKDLPFMESYLVIDTHHISWCDQSASQIDVVDFESLVEQATQVEKAGDIDRSVKILKEAVDLYQGDLVPACYTDWIGTFRDHFRQTYIFSLEHMISYKESRKDLNGAIHLARLIVQIDPFYENAHRILMHLLAINGNRAEALRSFHQCSELLKRELQVEPSIATVQLYESLLKQDYVQTNQPKPAFILPRSTPLIGRQKEWNQLLSIWNQLSVGKAHFALISGESGIGKTRLCDEVLTWAEKTEIQTVSVCCYSADSHLAYAPITAWLRSKPVPELDVIWMTEIARLLPEILVKYPHLQKPAPLTDNWQRQLFYEALVRTLFNNRRTMLLLIDNFHWIDEESLDWLYYLLRFNWHTPLLIIGALRNEELLGLEQVAFFLNAIRKNDQLTEIELPALSEEQTANLVQNLTGANLPQANASKLYRETGGNPLFVIEMIRSGWSLDESNLIANNEALPTVNLPTAIQTIIRDRLANLSTSARDLLGLAATIGQSFSLPVLAKASGMQEDDFVHALDELSRRQIVHEAGSDVYHFNQMKLRDVAYADLSSAKKNTFHRRLAEGLNINRFSPDHIS